ncbi:MAG: ORF6N domain-containing protein [Prevotellaceae bacterium]|jgi:hypothetical protein|nr:ORF6N domain-containing protein [Prevotellaceae bacterium]
MNNEIIISQKEVENRIFIIRDVQVMIDSDLAEMYGVETKALNQAVKRNAGRFPEEFRFQLTEFEFDNLRCQIGASSSASFLRSQIAISSNASLRSQIATLENDETILRSQIVTSKSDEPILRSQFVTSSEHGGRRYLPYVFTEQGVAMLSAVLRSEPAVRVSVQIMNAFVEMRKFITHNAALFQRLDKIEFKQIEADQKFEKIFKALESKELPEKGVFVDGQVYDAYTFVSSLIRKAKKSLILIDNYIDDTILTLFTKRANNVAVIFYTKNISKQLRLDVAKHNAQYEPITVIEFADAHDRFLIIDDKELYHIGASLKDLGKKWFAFSKLDVETITLLNKLKEIK